MSTNQVSSAAFHLITGRLGDDPIACATQSGRSMTIFSLKVTRRVQGEYYNTWYRIKTFGPLAEACLAYLHKDRLVQVQGNHMSVWPYLDTKSGEPRGALELVATNVTFLDPPNVNLAAMNILPTGDIPFSQVPEPAVDMAEAEELAVAG